MKTTIEISDSLLAKARKLAREQGLTLRSLTEEGLRRAIEERSIKTRFKVQPVTFSGQGLTKQFQGAEWESIRNAAYESHGS